MHMQHGRAANVHVVDITGQMPIHVAAISAARGMQTVRLLLEYMEFYRELNVF
jgi:hypothetical protein